MNLSDPHELATLLEGILLAAGKPLSLERLAELFDEAERPEPGQFRDALAILALSCAGRSFELKEVASGYRLQIRERFSPWVGRLWEERPQRYSRALLETLVLIAYRQPITRGEIEEIRGVAVNTQIVKTLMEREWIRIVGYREVPGRPAMLATTKAFLDYFNLKSLDELPPLSALREMEPEPEPPVEVAPAAQPPRDDLDEDAIPASIQALADRAIAEAGKASRRSRGGRRAGEAARGNQLPQPAAGTGRDGAGPEDRLRRPARPSGALGAGRRVRRASGWADSRGRGASRRACRRGGCRGRRSR